MPVYVTKRSCTDSDGNEGNWVVTDGNQDYGCHQDESDAEAQRDAINANLDE